jgi:hypothetical protein
LTLGNTSGTMDVQPGLRVPGNCASLMGCRNNRQHQNSEGQPLRNQMAGCRVREVGTSQFAGAMDETETEGLRADPNGARCRSRPTVTAKASTTMQSGLVFACRHLLG